MTEARRDVTGITLSVASIAALTIASFLTLRPFLGAAIWATMLVVSTWPLLLRLERVFKGKRWPAVTVLCVVFLLVLVVPFTAAVATIVEHAGEARAWLEGIATNGLPAAPAWLARVPLAGERLAASWNELAASGPSGLGPKLEPFAAKALQWGIATLGGVGSTLVHFLLTVGIAAVMYAKGESAADGLRAFVTKLSGARGPQIVKLAAQSIRGVALGIVLTSLIQALLVGGGLVVAGVPYAAAIALLVFMACVLQVGSFVIVIPCAIWLFSGARTAAAIGLLVWTGLAGAANGALRPFLIKRGGADMSILIILGGVIGGVIAFGVLGIFIGPLVLAVTSTLLDAWVRAEDTEG